MKQLLTFLGCLFLITTYYLLIQLNFFSKQPLEEFPSLKDRFGTMMWHTSDNQSFADLKSKQTSVYCYYPKGLKKGDYLLKEVKTIYDCQNYFGTVFFEENPVVTEREKFWWKEDVGS